MYTGGQIEEQGLKKRTAHTFGGWAQPYVSSSGLVSGLSVSGGRNRKSASGMF